jgi:hypothetical protein
MAKQTGTTFDAYHAFPYFTKKASSIFVLCAREICVRPGYSTLLLCSHNLECIFFLYNIFLYRLLIRYRGRSSIASIVNEAHYQRRDHYSSINIVKIKDKQR